MGWMQVIALRQAEDCHSFCLFEFWPLLFWLAVGLYVTKRTAEYH